MVMRNMARTRMIPIGLDNHCDNFIIAMLLKQCFLTMEGSVSRIYLATAIIVVTLGFIDSANATNSRAQGKAGQRALCHDKIGAKHLSGDPMKAEWKKCMEDANAYQ